MTETYKTGRLPPEHTLRTMRSAIVIAAALDPLGAAPAECRPYVDAVKDAGPHLYDNDIYGICCPASTANTLILRTANAQSAPVIPTLQNVLDLYHIVGGFDPANPDATDNGCTETGMCEFLMHTGGFLGHQSDATGMIDPRNQDHIKWCNYLFGSCRMGWNLPGYALDQFKAGKPWDVSTTGDQSISGHDAPIVDYRGGLYYVYTWGRKHPMTPAAVAAWGEESHAELFYDWVMAQGESPSGFDLETLAEKMEGIAND